MAAFFCNTIKKNYLEDLLLFPFPLLLVFIEPEDLELDGLVLPLLKLEFELLLIVEEDLLVELFIGADDL